MLKWTTGVLAGFVVLGQVSIASAQDRMARQNGHELANKLCSTCHATDPKGTEIRRADVPSFKGIANGPKATPEQLAAAIIIPHPAMPGIPLTRAEIQAVIAYILSLKDAR